MNFDHRFTPGLIIGLARPAFYLVLELPIILFRICNVLAMLIHGFGHSLMLFLATGNCKSFTAEIIFEGIRFSELVKSILPFHDIPQLSSNPPRFSWSLDSPFKYRMVAIGGILMNLLSVAGILWVYLIFSTELSEVSFASMFVKALILAFLICSLLTMISVPDIMALIKGYAVFWACGPAFAVRYKLSPEDKKSPYIVSERLKKLVEILSREASTRGGQSGGFALIVKKLDALSIIFDKVVKGKRDDIVKVLCQRILELLRKAKKEGFKRPGDFEVVLLHLRYATGGSTNWHNAQPHWYEHYESMMHHRIENKQLVSETSEVFNLIAHNGDMDGVHLEFKVDGKRIRQLFTQSEARSVFQTIMPSTTSQGDSDSRSVAEWVDFVYTQGLAFKALRYAYCTTVLDFNRDIAANRFNLDHLHQWADLVDFEILNAESSTATECLIKNAYLFDHVSDTIKIKIRKNLSDKAVETMDKALTKEFIAAFEEAFFRHDLTWVMRQASKDLVGEFALMVCSTLEPRMGVFSLTQAFSIGHNRTKGEIFGSAEPQGVTSSLHFSDADDEALQINLEDGQYATIEYEAQAGKESVLIYDRASETDDLSTRPKPSVKTLESRVLAYDSGWFPVNHNPKIDRSTREDIPGQEISRDISEIPFVLRRIVESFKPQGENFQTMDRFTRALFENLTNRERHPKKYDLVLFGVDFNQDLANEFAIAIHSILPDLKIRAENSGNVLKEIKRTKREGIGSYGPSTLFLGISNSAQTQSTLAALRKAEEFAGADRCFVLSQSLLNSMSQALGQGYHPEDPLLPNTFVNLSHLSPDGTCGRRRSEAATIVIVATQAVFTEILMGLKQKAVEISQSFPENTTENQGDKFEVRHDLQLFDIEAFREFQSVVYDVEIPNRVGYNAAGESIDSPDIDSIDKEARERAENHIEFVRSYALFALYIFVATVFGVPVFNVVSSPLHSIFGVSFVASILDAALFLSALWLIHMGIRFKQGRPVFERIGARAELFIDRKYIARIVERYNATLFSNAPAFLTPFFYWADTVQDALHRFGIRSHRGVVTIHRTPDERMGIEEANNAAEENMVFAQIGGIRFNFGQPQSRDRVRNNSRYMNRSAQDHKSRPFQTVLSDSLESLRKKYDQRLSPETLRLINRRLIDLSDGLIYEFAVGAKRKEIVNHSVWEVIRWIPGSSWVYRVLLNHGLDLRQIIGDADTANQAQIQSTKHPVSPIDTDIETMEPRPTVDALISQDRAEEDQSFAILVFFENYISIVLNGYLMQQGEHSRPQEILLTPGRFSQRGKLVNAVKDDLAGKFTGFLQMIDGEEYLVIDDENNETRINLPTAHLGHEQREFLKHQLKVETAPSLQAAA